MTPKGVLAGLVLAAAVAPWAAAELVEVVTDGVTVTTDWMDPGAVPEYVHLYEDNYLQMTAVFDSERAPIAQTESTAKYEALYAYATINDTVVPLSGVTLEVHTATPDEWAWFTLVGQAAEGWSMWVHAFSEDSNFVPSLAFPVDGFPEPDWDLYTRCDIEARGADWSTYTDQTFLPVFTRISDPPPVEGEWYNVPFVPQFGQFTIRYQATPSGGAIDGVTGLSRVVADSYTDMAPIVRFAPSGFVDARNGGSYQAAAPLRYHAGVTYQVEMTVDLWAKRYSATVTPTGGAPVVIANQFAFRSEHARANELGYLNTYAVGGTLAVNQVELIGPDTEAMLSAGTWENASLPEHDSSFSVSYTVTPSRTKLDAVTGLSHGTADWFTDLAVIVRFNPNGTVDARDYDRYRAVSTLSYAAGVHYHVTLHVDLATRRFSAVVQPEGGTARTIASNYRFRREQAAVTELDTFALFSNGGGATEVTDLAVD